MVKRIGMIAPLLLMAQFAMSQETGSVVKEIVVRGNQRVSREAILAVMRTRVGQPYIQENLDRDRQALLDLGFFQAVDVRPVPLEVNDWRITVDMVEWPEIKEIRVVGNTVVTSEEIVKAIEPFLKVGDVFNLNAQEPASRAIQELYFKKGYFAIPRELFPLEVSPNTLNVSIVETRVGTVSVQGNRQTKDWVMRRLVKTRSGDAFSAQKWTNDLRRLDNTQWFESVRSIQDDAREVGVIDLVADVKEARTGSFNVGLQLDPRNALAGIIQLRDTNFRGTGQAIGVNYLQATRGTGPSIDLDYTNPFFDQRDTTLRASIYSRLVFRFQNAFGSTVPIVGNQYFERRTGGSLGFSRPVKENLSLGVTARVESVRTDNLDAAPANAFIQQDGDIAVVTLGGILNRRDRDVDATRGDWIRLDLEPGYSNIRRIGGGLAGQNDLLGSNTFVRSTLEYRRYITDGPPLGMELDATRRVLALRARLGTISGRVPFFEQYFAGGADSVRGYPEDRFWGTSTFVSTAELRIPLQRSFSVVGFIDYGGAWGGYGTVNNFEQSKDFKLHLGYGMGLSFRTPLGPIRLDLGFDERGKTRTHFLIGTSF